jgi:hypothetical protein
MTVPDQVQDDGFGIQYGYRVRQFVKALRFEYSHFLANVD